MPERLALTQVKPVATQGDFFAGTGAPVYPAPDAMRGDELRAARFDRVLSPPAAAERLGITLDELLAAERGAYSFDIEQAKHLLRGGKP